MPTVKKSLMTRPVLDDDKINYFLTGIDHAFFWDEWERVRDWEAIRDDLLRDFARDNPGRRPFFWWVKDSPGPRLRVGGVGDVVPAYDTPMNLRYGIPRKSSFVSDRLLAAVAPVGAGLAVYDVNDPPVYESQASFLKRHKLFVNGEEKRLPPESFAPEVVR